MAFELSDSDYAHFLLGDIDLDAQLIAIRNVLARNRAADSALAGEIQEIAEQAKKAQKALSWRLDDLWVDRLHASVFQHASHSMAGAGMLAPLLETLFVRIFEAIGAEDWTLATTERRKRAKRETAELWNPQIYFPGGKNEAPSTNLILGIPQLAKETGLIADLPEDYAKVVGALFTYRNFMFHNGFEWRDDYRAKFDEASSTWPAEWFDRSRRDKRTWIVYMSNDFVQRCLGFVDEVLVAAGKFARRQGDAHGWRRANQDVRPT
jgi:hypothetical protein